MVFGMCRRSQFCVRSCVSVLSYVSLFVPLWLLKRVQWTGAVPFFVTLASCSSGRNPGEATSSFLLARMPPLVFPSDDCLRLESTSSKGDLIHVYFFHSDIGCGRYWLHVVVAVYSRQPASESSLLPLSGYDDT